ncbi:serine protease [Allofranklinella schreckenbergeri]|uniref:Serine protease n=2 Tax=Allofranklinella schreckenbergeri TaxID=1076744 RepID=A0A3M6R8K0_9BURK|nr:serine protease [Allofranklinella schreckenbergeri]
MMAFTREVHMKKLNIAMAVMATMGLSAAQALQAQEFFASSYHASEVAEQAAPLAFSPQFSAKLAKSARVAVTPTIIDLGALDDYSLIAKRAEAERPNVRMIGAARESETTASVRATTAQLKWQPLADGRQTAALQFHSGNAYGVRLGLLVQALPATAVVRVYAPGDIANAQEITGVGIQQVLKRNAEAGDTSEAGRTYWLPTIDGDAAVVQIDLPASASPSDVQVAVPYAAHIFESMLHLDEENIQKADYETNPNDPDPDMPRGMGIHSSDVCNYDASCQQEIADVRKSVARMVFVSGYRAKQDENGNPVLEDDGKTPKMVPVVATCTGTLLADKGHTGTPYLLTAAHCIDNQTVASTLETDWRFHTQSCSNSALSASHFRLTGSAGGARLVYSEDNYDTTLLVLNSKPYGDVVYAGWWTTQELHQAAYGISHPSGDLQKVSFGRISSYLVCTHFDENGVTECHDGLRDHSDFFDVNYSYGTTEGGSSGSGLFAWHQNGAYLLTGVLSAGSASCSSRDGRNVYGRFDRAYHDGLKYFLGEKATNYMDLRPVYRFFNTASGSHFYTQSVQERDIVIKDLPSFHYEGEAFWAYVNAHAQGPAHLSPVYRFFNQATGAHFYTISPIERDILKATASANTFKYEGVVWHARTVPGDGTEPVYRFYNTSNGSHFYTISHQEKLLIDAIFPSLHPEGVAYYAWPKTSQ